MAWEIYFAFTANSIVFERLGFLVWFIMDASFVVIAIKYAYAPYRRKTVSTRMLLMTLLTVGFLHILCLYYPDEREQVNVYWTGLTLQLPIGWGMVWVLFQTGDTKGQSSEIWSVVGFVHFWH